MSWRRQNIIDGTKLTTAYQSHEEKLYVHSEDVAAPRIYAANKQLRNTRSNPKVRLALQISQADLVELTKLYPAIARGKMEDRRKAWEQIAKDRPHLVSKPFQNKFAKGPR